MATIIAGQGTKAGLKIATTTGYTYIETTLPFTGSGQLSTFKFDQFTGSINPFFVVVVYKVGTKYKLRGWAELLGKGTGGAKTYNAPTDFSPIKVIQGDYIGFYSPNVQLTLNAAGVPNGYDIIQGSVLAGEWTTVTSHTDLYMEIEGSGEDFYSRFDEVDAVNRNYFMPWSEKTNVEVGDWNFAGGFKPTIRVNRWNDEWLEIAYPSASAADPTFTNFDNIPCIANWDSPTTTDEVNIYSSQPIASFIEDGLVNYELVVGVKPPTNVVNLDIFQGGKLNALKQNAYNAIGIPSEDDDLGVDYRTETEGRIGGSGGTLVVSIAERSTDSVAFYEEGQGQGYKSQIQAYNKRAGKFAQIIRVIATDDNGVQSYCDLDVDFGTNTLSITIPTLFYDSATYPMALNLEVGFTEFGATRYKTTQIIGPRFQINNSAGEVERLGVAVDDWDVFERIKSAIYETVSGDIVLPSSAERIEGISGVGWLEFDFKTLGGVDVDGATNYLAAIWMGDGQNIRRDICFLTTSGFNSDSSYNGFPTNMTVNVMNNFYSAYVRYVSISLQYFGINEGTFALTAQHTEYMYMAGTSPNIDNMGIKKLYVRMLSAGTITIAMYTGTDINDLTTFTRLAGTEMFNYTLGRGWNEIVLPATVSLPKNTVIALGWATASMESVYYSDNLLDVGDWQTANGRWKQTSPADADETAIMPAAPGAGVYANFYYAVSFEYRIQTPIDGSIVATFEETTMDASGEHPYTGSIVATLPETTMDATGSPQLLGTITTSFEETQFDAQGEHPYSGDISATFEETQFSAIGGKTLSGTIIATFEETGFSATGEKFQPGSIAVTFEETQFSASGEKTLLGDVAAILPETTMDAVGEKLLSGSITATFEETQMDAIGEYKFSGDIIATFEETTIVAAGGKEYQGSIVQNLRTTLFSATGIITILGEITSTLPETTMDAEGNVPFQGSINATLPETQMDAEGNRAHTGTIIATFEETLINAIGRVLEKIEGTINVTLPETEINANGEKYYPGSITATFEETQFIASGEKFQPGFISSTFEETLMSATGLLQYDGTINSILPETTMDARGGIPNEGTIDATFEETTIICAGRVFGFPVTWDLIKETLYLSVKKILLETPTSDIPVIWAEENGPQCDENYLTLRINQITNLGYDAKLFPKDRPGDIDYVGNVEFTFSIRGYGDNVVNYLQRIIAIYMNTEEMKQFLGNGNLVFIETLGEQNITELYDNRWKEVYNVDMRFRTHQQYTEDAGYIDSFELTSTYLNAAKDVTRTGTEIINLP